MRILPLFVVIASLGCTLLPGTPAEADTALTTTLVASGLSNPLFVTAPPGDTHRAFIVEQRSGNQGHVKILNLDTGTVNATPFLTVNGVSTGDEQGLLGLAFHPNYASNGYFYAYFTDSSFTINLRRYSVSSDPDVADPNSAYPILKIAHPSFSNHNGGWIAFGPDGYLYAGVGDGGSGGDPNGHGQDINVLLAKMLRIDVNGDDFPADPNTNYAIPPTNPFVGLSGRDEIWAYGLRNPWRCSFDRGTGALYIADVGQNAWEEIDYQPAVSLGGQDYGWRCYEGNHAYNTVGCQPENTMVFPIHEYAHNPGCSISGGYVYRGSQICDLRGTYFFADYCSARIWSFRYDGQNVTDFRDRTTELHPSGGPTIDNITSFGEDAAGELYICDRDGEVFKIVPVGPLKGDLNNDGVVNFDDIDAFIQALADPAGYQAQYGYPATQAGDFDCDGVVSFDDIPPFVGLLSSHLGAAR